MNFKEEDFKGKVSIVLIGGGCSGCGAVISEAREAALSLKIDFYYIDGEKDVHFSKEWAAEKLPALFIVNDGKPLAYLYGYQPREILELWIQSKLQENGL